MHTLVLSSGPSADRVAVPACGERVVTEPLVLSLPAARLGVATVSLPRRAVFAFDLDERDFRDLRGGEAK